MPHVSYQSRTFAMAAMALGLALAMVACGTGTGNGNSGGAGATDGSGGTGGDGGTTKPGGCTSTAQCRGEEVCNPETGTCTVQTVSCTGHAECGAAAFCDETGACVRNKTGGPCAEDGNCRPGEQCTGGFCGCKGEEFVAEAVAPNVLIMLDKSGSMDRTVGGTSKWDISISAIESLLATYGDSIRFGLVLYPLGRDSCSAGQIVVDIGEANASEILAQLASNSPQGSTPIGASLLAARNFEGLEDEGRENYVLLVTDGEEQCRGDGEAAVTALRQEEPEIKTFVVGFGGEVDAAELNAMAVAGGTEQPGTTKFYQADDAASLAAAFADIGGAVLSCSYQLSATGSVLSADDIFVYFDGVAVPNDETQAQGWEYDATTNQVTFHGSDCEALRNGTVVDLVIVHGCPIIIG